MDPFATITEMVDSAGYKADTLQEAESEGRTEADGGRRAVDDLSSIMLRMMPCKGRGRYFLCPITIVTRRQR